MRQLSRRAALALGAGTAAVTLVGWNAGALATPQAAGEDIAKFTGGATPEKGKISPSSPIGRCLLNKKVGEVAEVRVPKGTRYVEVLKLLTIHDAR